MVHAIIQARDLFSQWETSGWFLIFCPSRKCCNKYPQVHPHYVNNKVSKSRFNHTTPLPFHKSLKKKISFQVLNKGSPVTPDYSEPASPGACRALRRPGLSNALEATFDLFDFKEALGNLRPSFWITVISLQSVCRRRVLGESAAQAAANEYSRQHLVLAWAASRLLQTSVGLCLCFLPLKIITPPNTLPPAYIQYNLI